MRLALYQPDIPQNTGTILRLAACLAVPVDVIEPCGFAFYDKGDDSGCDKGLRRAALDYLEHVALVRHRSWSAFLAARAAAPASGRLVLLTTGGDESHVRFAFRADDVLLMGRESAGAPAEVHAAADARLVIPMAPGLRSLNVAVAAAIALGEALRQTGGFPGQAP
ncbi:MAG: tRNA (cytidine(34)-2'-O)-methyltransferase [Alphaproteobacteria bacterium]